MSDSTPLFSAVYTRYAGALIDLAQQSKSVDKVMKDLEGLEAMVNSSDDFSKFVHDPLIGTEEQFSAMSAIAKKAKLQPLTVNFLGVLVQNRRLNALVGISRAYKKAVSVLAGERDVCVETATKLTAAQTKDVQKKIEAALGGSVSIETKVTPEILGGMIVTIGSYMVDDSVRRKIDRLGAALKNNSNQNTIQHLKEVV